MLSIKKTITSIIDILGAPFTYLSVIWLKFIRGLDVSRIKLSKRIFVKTGIFPIRDHYYEPLFNPKHLRRSLRKDRILRGIDLNIKEQLKILNNFKFNHELLSFPLEKTNKLEFYYHNRDFEAGDAEYLYNAIRYYKPNKIIEIGSGNSTLMAINAINANKNEDPKYNCELTCIEPYENPWLKNLNINLIQKCVEEVDRDIFCKLNGNDILFIDSSHIIRPQGDVLFEYLQILPILKRGVLVHIHDIFTPKDYLDKWMFDDIKFFNEQYLLEAFLMFNIEYKIIGSLNYLKHHYFSELSRAFPIFEKEPHAEPGSFWIAKK